MEEPNLSELTRPKSKALLSTSINREELLAGGVCVSCRTYLLVEGTAHCPRCRGLFALIDRKAFAGFMAEVART